MTLARTPKLGELKKKGGGMKKIVFSLCLLFVAAFSAACSKVAPDAGHEAVLIRKPFFFGHGGVGESAVRPGLSWFAPTTYHVYVNMQPQLFMIHFDDFMSKDGVPLDFDVALRLQITDSVKMVRDFGVALQYLIVGNTKYTYPRWYVNNVHKNLENAVRQAVRGHGMNETAISTIAIDEIDAELTRTLKTYLESIGLPVKLVDFTVGRANPPDAIKDQRIETARQEQRVNTEKQRKLAEDQRKLAETARAAADNAYRNDMQLSPAQFLALEQIRMQRDVCVHEKCTFVMGGSGGVVPTINVGK